MGVQGARAGTVRVGVVPEVGVVAPAAPVVVAVVERRDTAIEMAEPQYVGMVVVVAAVVPVAAPAAAAAAAAAAAVVSAMAEAGAEVIVMGGDPGRDDRRAAAAREDRAPCTAVAMEAEAAAPRVEEDAAVGMVGEVEDRVSFRAEAEVAMMLARAVRAEVAMAGERAAVLLVVVVVVAPVVEEVEVVVVVEAEVGVMSCIRVLTAEAAVRREEVVEVFKADMAVVAPAEEPEPEPPPLAAAAREEEATEA